MLPSSAQFPGIALRTLWPTAELHGVRDLRATSCSGDSRAVLPGDVFVAMDGAEYDGHEFAAHAVARGAVAIIAERPLPLCGVPVCVVGDSRRAYGELCHALAGEPAKNLKVIGVTGESGKTTVALLVAAVLEEAGFRAGLLSSLGWHDGIESHPPRTLTAPGIAGALAEMQANGCTHAVVEIPSGALADTRLAGLELAGACVTNLTSEHSGAAVARSCMAAASFFARLAGDGFAVLNTDDPTIARLSERVDRPALTVGLGADAQVTATPIEQLKSEQTFLLSAGSDSAVVRTFPVGQHHISNCLIAAAVGLAHGIELATIVRGLEQVRHIPGRLERIECGQSFGVFVDGVRSARSLAHSLSVLRRVTTGRLICVLGGDQLATDRHRLRLGRAAEAGADLAIVTCGADGAEDGSPLAEQIMAGFEQPALAELVPNRARAIARALASAEDGDTVLIATSGSELGMSDAGSNSDDRQIARRLLYNIDPFDSDARSDDAWMPIGNH